MLVTKMSTAGVTTNLPEMKERSLANCNRVEETKMLTNTRQSHRIFLV